jgi:uncharacterized Ntn-hydrolase superfamily protein
VPGDGGRARSNLAGAGGARQGAERRGFHRDGGGSDLGLSAGPSDSSFGSCRMRGGRSPAARASGPARLPRHSVHLCLPMTMLRILPGASFLRSAFAGAALLPILLVVPAAQGQEPPLSTFSIVACDAEQGFLGVGVQSRVVGAGAIVPAAEGGVGAIASQAAANVAFKEEGLALLRDGLSPEAVRDSLLATDGGRQNRQFAVMGAECTTAVWTGESTLEWSGHLTGPGYSVQGNILAGEEVLEEMARAFEAATAERLPFGERILAALKAGQDAGGDVRGRQGAGLLVVREGGGYGGGDDRYADLRVEDHVEPILELERVYGVWMRVFHPVDHYAPRGSESIGAPSGPHICALKNLLAEAGHGNGAGSQRPCWFDEETIADLRAFQREHGLPERPVLDRDVARILLDAAGGS